MEGGFSGAVMGGSKKDVLHNIVTSTGVQLNSDETEESEKQSSKEIAKQIDEVEVDEIC